MTDDTPRPSLQTASNTDSPLELAPSQILSNPSFHVDVLIHDERWDLLALNLPALFQDCLAVTLNEVMATRPSLKVLMRRSMDLSVLLTDDEEIQQLNKDYRRKDKPTNILSFEGTPSFQQQSERVSEESKDMPPIALGDLVLSYETIFREAQEQDKILKDHLTHLIIHGLLHLMGYDHEDDGDAEVMESLEIHILKTHFKINNPYAEI